MINLLKTFGKGILYVIGMPFFLLALAIFALIGLVAFLFQIVKSVIFFFTGQKFFPELEEDKQLRMKREMANNLNKEEDADNHQTQSKEDIITPINEEIITNTPIEKETTQEEVVTIKEDTEPTIEEVCFKEEIKPSLVEEEDVPAQEEDVILSDLVLEDEKEEIEKEQIEEEEELETYVPRSSNYNDEIEEDDSDTSGVDIKYDL